MATAAVRAQRAFAAMQSRFSAARGGYRRDGRLHLPGAAAHLWPFARALVATLDLAGVAGGPPAGFDAGAEVGQRLVALEHYWDQRGQRPAYSSDVIGTRIGGDRYYDDNAWVGLALVQAERMRPGSGWLGRAAELFEFALRGWDTRPDVPSPGGVFWVEQGVGAGSRNHDRNTVSTAPNAQLGLHLAELGGAPPGGWGTTDPRRLYAWVNAALGGEPGDGGGDAPPRREHGLFADKVRGDGSIDRTLWSYNQGSMVGLNVLLARAGGTEAATFLERAEAIARRALRHYGDGLHHQPPAFNAIFFRNLLLLHAATGDAQLRAEIQAALRGYAEWAWSARRAGDVLGPPGGGPTTLLDQSALVSVLALLAWDPADYGRLA